MLPLDAGDGLGPEWSLEDVVDLIRELAASERLRFYSHLTERIMASGWDLDDVVELLADLQADEFYKWSVTEQGHRWPDSRQYVFHIDWRKAKGMLPMYVKVAVGAGLRWAEVNSFKLR